jgi:LysR family hydrogen peroxide-inducible transcriptional activator
LGIIPTVASYLIPDLYDSWREKLVNIQLIIEELKTEDLLLAFEKGQLDLGILSGPINDNRLRINPLYTEEIKAYYPSGKSPVIQTNELSDMHPWLLTPGNCLRTQMMHFCQLKNETENDEWDYQGGNLDLLVEMVDKNGGYTLVPEHHIRNLNSNYKSIISERGEFPAREIIAISSNRTGKWESIEKIVRACQLKYYSRNDENFTTLSWS